MHMAIKLQVHIKDNCVYTVHFYELDLS